MLTPHEKLNLIESLKKAIEVAEVMPTTTACYDCASWGQGSCKKWNETIPEDVVESGCDQWEFDPSSPPF